MNHKKIQKKYRYLPERQFIKRPKQISKENLWRRKNRYGNNKTGSQVSTQTCVPQHHIFTLFQGSPESHPELHLHTHSKHCIMKVTAYSNVATLTHSDSWPCVCMSQSPFGCLETFWLASLMGRYGTGFQWAEAKRAPPTPGNSLSLRTTVLRWRSP